MISDIFPVQKGIAGTMKAWCIKKSENYKSFTKRNNKQII